MDSTIPPPVVWAQRKDHVIVTVQVSDCKNANVRVEADKLHFDGIGNDKKHYAITMELFGEVDTGKSRHHIYPRQTEIYLSKKDKTTYWQRLLKTQTKMHWLKVDFSRWKDSDDSDSDEQERGQNLDDMMREMGGLSSGEKPGMEDFGEEEDSDDAELPDLE
ncbi:PREDICTED: co-chaperone protein daf-41-like [Priapulus caudatus]|uniref:Co-chaperone protein daf-41-like n=1 Tax=Priapulus caudatus TaxID=37621 RepID=A0ABM1ERP2_PRICU|nr:PREDICTED: co-chaperone protein daf-41-like [Priapulus caudatus]